MSGDKKYQPMNCEIHDGYELACMRNAIHEVTWLDNDTSFTEKLRFLDIQCTQGAEYLIAENNQQATFKIRLDTITSTLPY